MDRQIRYLSCVVVCLLVAGVSLAEPLRVDISTGLSEDRLDPAKGNVTLKVRVKSQAEYRDLSITVATPTAKRLAVEPAKRTIDLIGADETRGEYRFQILDKGQDPGSYKVTVTVADAGGSTATKSVTLFVGGEPSRLPAPGAPEALGALAVLGLLFARGARRRRR
ncbi:MAG: PKD domain-containing protein [Euryarchaeota archaeon]|nr:PKD domain-containing protein [Euryarchaeota archaeon]